ncbi:transcriptional regulator, LacI family [Paenibacillus sp. UNCCL117]|uniref:LacI family DNA-binding transcriptional regulator n=1 Tax=unclassified Paenibacillus TaxID=185978 RepID=UPI00088DEE75|nr:MULTISPECIES: LacI family DNA-binding transcriptional regulator [unclassified Paenibacillus]SDC66748.1 transcriptional regulator, LacI family [Paenibacillus sp. cl123]SFW23131.1 transcriptional regulator, LacI family [Paenibacillus sp. UNCCL117]
MSKPTTIHDIARMANVSSATVSRVLSNSSYPVSQGLKEKIQRIAKESNYVPNMLGKQLKTNISTTIGVVIPSIVNPFYASVVFGVEEVARYNNYTVIACSSLQDAALEDEYIRMIMEKQVKGLIISSITTDKSQLKSLMKLGVSVIAIDQKVEEEGIVQIEFDYRKGGYLATRHLLANGHSRIGYVTSRMDRPSRKSICQGYMDAMSEADLPTMIVESSADDPSNALSEFDAGKRLTDELLSSESRPTAIFACNDMMAFGVINELSLREIHVPQDMSVMGFDGIEMGQMIHPPLTTIKQPDYEMGRMACKMLFDMMKGEDNPLFNVTLQPKLIERKSVRHIGQEQ